MPPPPPPSFVSEMGGAAYATNYTTVRTRRAAWILGWADLAASVTPAPRSTAKEKRRRANKK